MSTIGFIGSGNMAEALMRGLLTSKTCTPQDILISDVRPERLRELADRYGVTACDSNAQAVGRADTVILSVKPQVMSDALQSIQGSVRRHALHLHRGGRPCGEDRRRLGRCPHHPRDAQYARPRRRGR